MLWLLSRWSKCWALHTLAEKPYWGNSGSHTTNQRANFQTTAGDNGSRATRGGSQRWKLYVQSHWNHIESRKKLFIVTAQWDVTENLRRSVLSVPNSTESYKYPPNDDLEFQLLPQKKKEKKSSFSYWGVLSLMRSARVSMLAHNSMR